MHMERDFATWGMLRFLDQVVDDVGIEEEGVTAHLAILVNRYLLR